MPFRGRRTERSLFEKGKVLRERERERERDFGSQLPCNCDDHNFEVDTPTGHVV